MSVRDIDDVERLKRINQVLIDRMERVTDQQRNAFSLFQTAITLDDQVRQRTEELNKTLGHLEVSNSELARQREIADEANQSKTRFLAAASHDILQPLQAARLSISALQDLQTTDQGARLVDQVERSLETMDELLRTLLDISKLDAGVVEAKMQPVSLAAMSKRLEADFRPLAEKKGLDLRFRLADLWVHSDPAMLQRVLQNLIANALKYTTRGGVLIGTRKSGGDVLIDVVDTGQGIADDVQARIFDEFFRATRHEKHVDDRAALGLGLSIVRRLVDVLDHSLDLISSPGSGSRFRLTLAPATASLGFFRRPVPAVKMSAPSFQGRRILIVENDMAVRAAMDEAVKVWGFETRLAATQSVALSQLNDGWQPDVIIADQQLDRGDLGTRTIGAIRRGLGFDVPALVLTANPSEETKERAENMGLDLVRKPVKPAELRALIGHLLSET
ncbi:MAG: hybrid sensor histidine kinase/response regulator [Pseudomonadota bacterium]